MLNDSDTGRLKAVAKDFLVERFEIPADKLTDDTHLRDLGLDSIMMLDVMLEIEDRLNLKMDDLSMPTNPTLDDIVAVIERNMAAAK
jgi:acyl carrier protein